MEKEIQDRAWHKNCDIPEEGKICLVEYNDPDGILSYRVDKRTEFEWIKACHYDRIIRWAYIEDLLPNEKGEEKQSELLKYIRERQRAGKVVLATVEGLMECGIEELVDQPVDGLLYDLNRNEATSYALGGKRAVNDIAVAQVIRHLHAKVSGHGKGSEKGARK